jgi:hypothetical protein
MAAVDDPDRVAVVDLGRDVAVLGRLLRESGEHVDLRDGARGRGGDARDLGGGARARALEDPCSAPRALLRAPSTLPSNWPPGSGVRIAPRFLTVCRRMYVSGTRACPRRNLDEVANHGVGADLARPVMILADSRPAFAIHDLPSPAIEAQLVELGTRADEPASRRARRRGFDQRRSGALTTRPSSGSRASELRESRQ